MLVDRGDRYVNVVLTDKKSKTQIDVSGNGDDSMRIAVAKWLSQTTGAIGRRHSRQ